MENQLPSRHMYPMNQRPAHLPDYDEPPIHEVVLGIQFAELKGMTSAHGGVFWSMIRDEFPICTENAPLPASFELFGGFDPSQTNAPSLALFDRPPMNRFWFIHSSDLHLIQLQQDRLWHNWRKMDPNAQYPHFEEIAQAFEENVALLTEFVAIEKLGQIECNQCEVSYINHIRLSPAEDFHQAITRVFGEWYAPNVAQSANQEEAAFSLSYRMGHYDNPIGRLRVMVKPTYLKDGVPIISMTLTAKGAPINDGDYIGFMKEARQAIVEKFTNLTSKAMHKAWRRKK